jgi:hypothetical protein
MGDGEGVAAAHGMREGVRYLVVLVNPRLCSLIAGISQVTMLVDVRPIAHGSDDGTGPARLTPSSRRRVRGRSDEHWVMPWK